VANLDPNPSVTLDLSNIPVAANTLGADDLPGATALNLFNTMVAQYRTTI